MRRSEWHIQTSCAPHLPLMLLLRAELKGMSIAIYNPTKTKLLAQARKEAGLTQREAAAYFGLMGTHGHQTFGKWERGQELCPEAHRLTFIRYLWYKLNLQRDSERMDMIWREVMVGQWDWAPLADDEGKAQTHIPQEIP